jgi:hypothetical protein
VPEVCPSTFYISPCGGFCIRQCDIHVWIHGILVSHSAIAQPELSDGSNQIVRAAVAEFHWIHTSFFMCLNKRLNWTWKSPQTGRSGLLYLTGSFLALLSGSTSRQIWPLGLDRIFLGHTYRVHKQADLASWTWQDHSWLYYRVHKQADLVSWTWQDHSWLYLPGPQTGRSGLLNLTGSFLALLTGSTNRQIWSLGLDRIFPGFTYRVHKQADLAA